MEPDIKTLLSLRQKTSSNRKGTTIWPTFKDGLAVAEVVEAVLKSAQAGLG